MRNSKSPPPRADQLDCRQRQFYAPDCILLIAVALSKLPESPERLAAFGALKSLNQKVIREKQHRLTDADFWTYEHGT